MADTGDTSTTLGSLLKGGDEWKEIPLTGSAGRRFGMVKRERPDDVHYLCSGTLFVTAKTWMDVTWTILHAYPTPFQPLEEGGSGYQAGVDHGESLLKELTNKEKAVFLGIAIEGSKGDRGELLSLPFSIPMVREVAGKSTEPIGAAPRERASSMQQAGLLGRGRRLVRPRSLLQQFLEERQQLPATTDSEVCLDLFHFYLRQHFPRAWKQHSIVPQEDVLQLLASLALNHPAVLCSYFYPLLPRLLRRRLLHFCQCFWHCQWLY